MRLKDAKAAVARIKAETEGRANHPMTRACPDLKDILDIVKQEITRPLDCNEGQEELLNEDDRQVCDYVIEHIGKMNGALEAYDRCAGVKIRQWQEAAKVSAEGR